MNGAGGNSLQAQSRRCSHIHQRFARRNATASVNMLLRKVTKNWDSQIHDQTDFFGATEYLQEKDNADPQLAIGIESIFDNVKWANDTTLIGGPFTQNPLQVP